MKVPVAADLPKGQTKSVRLGQYSWQINWQCRGGRLYMDCRGVFIRIAELLAWNAVL